MSPMMVFTFCTLSTISVMVTPASLTSVVPAFTRSTEVSIRALISLAADAELHGGHYRTRCSTVIHGMISMGVPASTACQISSIS